MLPAVPAVVQVVDVLSAPELSDDDVMSKICSRDLVARPLAPVTKECEVVAALGDNNGAATIAAVAESLKVQRVYR